MSIIKQATKKMIDSLWMYFEGLGYHIVPDHYYYPIPNHKELLKKEPWKTDFPRSGIFINEKAQLETLSEIMEIDSFEWDSNASDRSLTFTSNNGMFPVPDAILYYHQIRKYKPDRIIEVGAGYSSQAAAQALSTLDKDVEHICIEPYPPEYLADLNSRPRVIDDPVQEIDSDIFKDLSEDDILFIDSSHVVAPGSDVVHLFLRVLPTIDDGVLVHVHDIFYPQDYREEVHRSTNHYLNEQYLIQAFLLHNDKYNIEWMGGWLSKHHPDRLNDAFNDMWRPILGSLWMKK